MRRACISGLTASGREPERLPLVWGSLALQGLEILDWSEVARGREGKGRAGEREVGGSRGQAFVGRIGSKRVE